MLYVSWLTAQIEVVWYISATTEFPTVVATQLSMGHHFVNNIYTVAPNPAFHGRQKQLRVCPHARTLQMSWKSPRLCSKLWVIYGVFLVFSLEFVEELHARLTALELRLAPWFSKTPTPPPALRRVAEALERLAEAEAQPRCPKLGWQKWRFQRFTMFHQAMYGNIYGNITFFPVLLQGGWMRFITFLSVLGI